MKTYNHFVNGKEMVPSSGKYFDTENPYTCQNWAKIANGYAGVSRRLAIMNSLDSIYINSGAFPIQILSLLPYLVECSELPSELSTAGLDINSSKCLSDKLASNFSGIGENFLLEIPQIIQDVESCSINSEELLSYFEIEIPSSNDDLEIPEELQDRVLGDDRFICLSEKLELSDVLEFLYTGTLSDSVINSANECDISKEEIEDLDISELLN